MTNCTKMRVGEKTKEQLFRKLILLRRRVAKLKNSATEGKRAVGVLRECEQHLREMLENIQGITVTLDIQGNIIFCNDLFLGLIGWQRDEIIGRNWFDTFVPREEQIKQIFTEKVTQGMPPLHFENEILTRQGERRFISWSSTYLRDSSGNIIGMNSIGTDITERKRAEEARKREKELSEKIINSSVDGIFALDGTYRVIIWNPGMECISGISKMEILGRCIFDVLPFLKGTGEDKFFFEALAGNPVVAKNRPYVIPETGRSGFFEASYSPLFNESGEIMGALAIIHDITERKRLEEALRKAEETYRNIFENAVEGMFQATVQGRYLSANPALATMYGYESPEELLSVVTDIGQQVYVDPNHRLELLRLIQEKGVVRNFQTRVYQKDGGVIWISMNQRGVFDNVGRLLYYEGMVQDITERKRAEEALRQAEERYRSIFENAVEGIFQSTPEGRYISANPAQARMLGYDSPEELMKSITDIAQQVFVESERRQEFNRLLKEHGVVKGFEFQASRKDGSKIWISSNVRAVRNATRDVVYYEGTAEDITERKRAEEAVKRSEEAAQRLAAENEILAGIGRIISSTLDIEEVYERFAQEVQKLIPFDRISINIIHPEKGMVSIPYVFGVEVKGRQPGDTFPLTASVAEEVMRRQSGLILQAMDLIDFHAQFPTLVTTWESGIRSLMAVPLISEGRIIGVLHFRSCKSNIYTDQDLRIAENIGRQIGGAVASGHLYAERKRADERIYTYQEQLRSLTSEMSLAEERERRRIATDLHDHIGQTLALTKIKLGSLREMASCTELAMPVNQICEMIDQAIQSTRTLTFELSPPVLYELGFDAAMEWLAEQIQDQHHIEVDLEDDRQSKPMSDEIRISLFKAVRELLINIIKHAKAHKAKVSTRREDNTIRITVEDDGAGFSLPEDKILGKIDGYGLFSIRERLKHLGGSFEIESKLGCGTRITLAAPLEQENNGGGVT